MKKIVSLLSVALVAMVMLVSCASENQKKSNAIAEAIAANDYAQAEKIADELFAIKDQLTASEGINCFLAYNNLGAKAVDDPTLCFQYYQKALDVYQAIKDKSDAKSIFEQVKSSQNFDVVAVVDQVNASIEAGKQAAVAQAQAEAEEAEEGSDAEEGEEEIEEVEAE